MINSRQAAKTAAVADDRREAIRALYMESLQLVERLHRRLLDGECPCAICHCQ